MRLAIIGGVGRQGPRLIEMARAWGHVLELHSGEVRGRGAEALRAVVERAELVILVTGINSHPGVLSAKRTARALGRGLLLVTTFGTSRFERLLEALAVARRRRWAALDEAA